MIENDIIEHQAASWVAREDGGLTSAEASALASWLDESTVNRIAYLRLKAAWEHSARLAALKNSVRFADRSSSIFLFARLTRLGAIAAVALLAGGLTYHFWPTPKIVYTAKTGERPMLRLSDGTQIQLNTNTQVQTSITRESRLVTLQKGEAYFEVVHDESRPFVVLAGNHRIIDLGTKFSVRRVGDDVRVVVTEGHVRVETVEAPLPVAPVYAGEGNVVVAEDGETLVAAKSPQAMSDELGWRTGMIILDQKTLAEAADEFNRYNHKKIQVEGAARDIHIGGSFRADNIDVFASLVRNALGLTVVNGPDEITISK